MEYFGVLCCLLIIDFFSNVEKNYYVTATCSRADPKEVRVYNLAFGNTIKFGSELQKEKNVVYQLIFYNSDPSLTEQAGISTKYGVSTYRFADYAFKRDKYKTIYAIYFESETEDSLSKTLGISQSAVHYRRERILRKLKNILNKM